MSSTTSQRRTDTASRVIAASPESLYRAFIDASSVMEWLPPKGMSGKAIEYDFQEGGRYRIELKYDDQLDGSGKTTNRTDISKGRFIELIPNRRIKQTVEFESEDQAFAGEMTMTWAFDTVPNGTQVTITAENVPSGISKEDHDTGLNSSLENLARFVEREA